MKIPAPAYPTYDSSLNLQLSLTLSLQSSWTHSLKAIIFSIQMGSYSTLQLLLATAALLVQCPEPDRVLADGAIVSLYSPAANLSPLMRYRVGFAHHRGPRFHCHCHCRSSGPFGEKDQQLRCSSMAERGRWTSRK